MGLDCRRKNPFGSGFGCLVVTLSFAQFVMFCLGLLPLYDCYGSLGGRGGHDDQEGHVGEGGRGGHGSSLLFFNLSFTDWKEISCKPG